MTLLLLDQWKKKLGGLQNASAFLLALESDTTSAKEKGIIIDALNDWDLLTPTWFEVAEYVHCIEQLYEDVKFEQRFRAALLASKVHYCLCDYHSALNLALDAQDEFQLTPKPHSVSTGPQDEQYVNKMIEHALDIYKKLKWSGSPDSRLENLVDRIFERNMKRKELRYVIGLALDTRRIDMIFAAVKASDDKAGLLTETVSKVVDLQLDRAFRSTILDLLLKLFLEEDEPNFVTMCHCLIRLEKPAEIAEILNRLISNKGDQGILLAYQIAFDLYENASQRFIKKIENALLGDESRKDWASGDANMSTSFERSEEDTSETTETGGRMSNDSNDDAVVPGSSCPVKSDSTFSIMVPVIESTVGERLRSILCGEQTIKHHMQFLIKNNHTDMLILKQIRDGVRTSSVHNATVIANGFMHFGTTTDDFLRANLEWISRATNWNKFNAVASLGLIHKGHEENAQKLLEPYLPQREYDQFGFKEGGSLYAYGLMHANHGNEKVIAYLCEQQLKACVSAVRHGACLGIGLAAMGNFDEKVYHQLRSGLYQDEAVVGEAAGLAIGLLCVGGLQSSVFQEMVQYACDTQHEKIQRGLRIGMALLAYGHQEEAEPWVEQLLRYKSNAILRSTAVCVLAMAYAGSGNANVVRRLLARVAADPNQDVKRFAVIGIGFVLSNEPEQCLNYIGMLVEHFNPHVRYGAVMALGIACAGSGYKEAISAIEPSLSAKENFVRQGAAISLAFILIQQTDASSPKAGGFRKTLTKLVTDRTEDSITKFGGILAQGIIDAGGRNVTISLHNRNGHSDMQSVVGIFVFLQHWYWHSFAHFISLAFKPTCLIGLNIDLEMPKIEFRCSAKPSTFAYPPPLEEKKKEESGKVETAVLSVTSRKMSASGKKQKRGKKMEKMEVDASPLESIDENKPASETKSTVKRKESESLAHSLQNPARVMRLQLKTLQMPESSRYEPLKSLSEGGIIMLFDKSAGLEQEEIVPLVEAGGDHIYEAYDQEDSPHSSFEVDIESY